MRRALLAALTLAACSSDPAPPAADAGDDAVVVDAGNDTDTAPPADQGAPADTSPLDAGNAEDASPAADADASLPPGDDGSAMDAGHDAGPADAGQLDAGPGDTGGDAGADAGVVVADAGSDAGVDVPRDVGVDAGPVTYDLEAERTGLEVRVVYRLLYREGPSEDCATQPSVPSCSVRRSDNTLRFSFEVCSGRRFTAMVPLSGAGALVQMLTGTGRITNITDPLVTQGASDGRTRRSFLVQIAQPSTTTADGVSGVPGRTGRSTHGDLWLLGCPVE